MLWKKTTPGRLWVWQWCGRGRGGGFISLGSLYTSLKLSIISRNCHTLGVRGRSKKSGVGRGENTF